MNWPLWWLPFSSDSRPDLGALPAVDVIPAPALGTERVAQPHPGRPRDCWSSWPTSKQASLHAPQKTSPDSCPSPPDAGRGYDAVMLRTLEDDRGVDVARIRELLALTPAQRVARMVEVATVLCAVRDRAEAARK